MTVGTLPWRDAAELRLARGLRRWLQWRKRTVESAPRPQLRRFDFGSEASDGARKNAGIPRILWAYWDGGVPPTLIARCFDNWRRLHPHFSIRIVDERSLGAYVDELPPQWGAATPTLRADWLRLELLRRHGGIWLDASTILTQPLDWVVEAQARDQSDLVAFYLGRFTTDAAFPVVENWFLAAPPGSPLVDDLQREFTEQVLPRGGAAYARHLQAQVGYERLLQGIDMPHYLSMHLALQLLLRGGTAYRLSLGLAEDGPFFYHALGHWGRTALKIRLLFRVAADMPPPLIKLRKPDRKRLDLYLERELYLPESTVGRYLFPLSET